MLFSVAHSAWVGTYDILILSPFSRRNIKTACYMHTGVIPPPEETLYSETVVVRVFPPWSLFVH